MECSSAIVVNSQFSVSTISGSCDKITQIDDTLTGAGGRDIFDYALL
jgi:hypothetical protein